MRVYGRQAKNMQLELDAAEIRLRAERRLGEMMAEGADDRAPEGGTGANQHMQRGSRNPVARPTLSQLGIDKNLAKRARVLASSSSAEFERQVRDYRRNDGVSETPSSRPTLRSR
jgi:hypothetical protein